MVACTACDGVFMIEMDGSVTVPSLEDPMAEPSADPTAEPMLEEASSEAYGASDGGSADEPSDSSTYESPGEGEDPDAYGSESSEDNSYESLDAGEAVAEEVSTEDYAAQEETPVEETEYSESFMDDFDNPKPPIEEAANDPLGVTRFDGAEASQMADGPFYYDLRITGIDTAQLKNQVIEVLSDNRLGWSPDEIKKQIKMGQLLLESLNPVRAVLAVLRLQALDVDVEWDQRPFTADPETPPDQEAT